jgi:hypothetical protein
MGTRADEPVVGGSEPGVEGTSEVTGRARTYFKKGHTAGRGRNRKGEGKGRPKPCGLLRDMRAVLKQDETKDRTPVQRMVRQLLKENPADFLRQMTKLEAAHQTGAAKKAAASPQKPADADEGEERVLALLDEQLARFAAEQARQDAELAARPNTAEFAATLRNRLAGALDREERLRQRVEELERHGAAREALVKAGRCVTCGRPAVP